MYLVPGRHKDNFLFVCVIFGRFAGSNKISALKRCRAGEGCQVIGMTCSRCDGLRRIIKMKDAVSGESTSGWQCLLCGDVIDSVIVANRKGHTEPMSNRARLPGSVPAGTGRSKFKRVRYWLGSE